MQHNIAQYKNFSFLCKIWSYVMLPLLPVLSDAKNLSDRLGLRTETHFQMNTVADFATFSGPRTEHEPEKIGVHMTKETRVKTKQNKIQTKTKTNKTMPTLVPFPSSRNYCHALTLKAVVPPWCCDRHAHFPCALRHSSRPKDTRTKKSHPQ